MIRRLIRWLARKEIQQAGEAGEVVGRLAGALVLRLETQTAYLKGYHEGGDQAYDEIESAIHARTGGRAEVATIGDVEMAKKRRTH